MTGTPVAIIALPTMLGDVDQRRSDVDQHQRRMCARLMTALRLYASTAVDLALPRLCPGCHAPGSWCGQCASTIAGRPRAVTPPEQLLDRLAALGLAVPPIHALTRYGDPVRAAIVAGKERGRRDLPPIMGRALGLGLATLCDAAVVPTDIWLVPAPTKRASARARGGDPVLTMARSAAATLAECGGSVGVSPCLYLARRTRDSVGLDAAGRAANLADSVRFDARGAPPPHSACVLLDDVLTSGATMVSSYQALQERGLRLAGVMVLAAVPPLRAGVMRGRGDHARGR